MKALGAPVDVYRKRRLVLAAVAAHLEDRGFGSIIYFAAIMGLTRML